MNHESLEFILDLLWMQNYFSRVLIIYLEFFQLLIASVPLKKINDYVNDFNIKNVLDLALE